MTVRAASESDAAAMLAIDRPCVEHSAISFEDAVLLVDVLAARVRGWLAAWACHRTLQETPPG